MRVTAGIYKGRSLDNGKYEHLRPTADVVKQALFNALAFKVQGARVLDLFSGTGALGIEAISRGASEVIFVDKDPRSVVLTKANLSALKIDAKVIKAPYDAALKTFDEGFDIILLDPPYKSGYYAPALNLIRERKLLNPDGIIVCEHNRDDKIDSCGYIVKNEKVYGIKCLTYLVMPD